MKVNQRYSGIMIVIYRLTTGQWIQILDGRRQNWVLFLVDGQYFQIINKETRSNVTFSINHRGRRLIFDLLWRTDINILSSTHISILHRLFFRYMAVYLFIGTCYRRFLLVSNLHFTDQLTTLHSSLPSNQNSIRGMSYLVMSWFLRRLAFEWEKKSLLSAKYKV